MSPACSNLGILRPTTAVVAANFNRKATKVSSKDSIDELTDEMREEERMKEMERKGKVKEILIGQF